MRYIDILYEVKRDLPSDRQWWPDYFYHFTDVHNAAKIIESGWIYSRSVAKGKSVMINDNASRVVIDMTSAENKTYGRLYFRPLTPTQYHNEGFKPGAVRNHNINASCPVPVFFLLSVEKTMDLDNVKFAEKGISGRRSNLQTGETAFSRLNFEKIYHDGGYDPQLDSDIKEYRQSEVVREGGFPLARIIRGIVCRSTAERETLLYLLRKDSPLLYDHYKSYIMRVPLKKMFYDNGIYIKNVSLIGDELNIELNSKELRYGRKQESVMFKVKVLITYVPSPGQPNYYDEGRAEMDYCTVEAMVMRLTKSSEYASAIVKIMFNNAVMYENEIILSDSQIW